MCDSLIPDCDQIWCWSRDLVLVSRFAVNESPVQFRLVTLNHGGKSLWEGNLIVYQVAAGSTPVAIAFIKPHSTTG